MVTGGLSADGGVEYYRIDGLEVMEPFLMTVVSESDLWMFISSAGALTAGRIDADHALFPYETDDRLHRAAGLAGRSFSAKSIQVSHVSSLAGWAVLANHKRTAERPMDNTAPARSAAA